MDDLSSERTQSSHELGKDVRRGWDLNRGLIGLSSILIAWVFLAVMMLDGLSHLSSLWPVG